MHSAAVSGVLSAYGSATAGSTLVTACASGAFAKALAAASIAVSEDAPASASPPSSERTQASATSATANSLTPNLTSIGEASAAGNTTLAHTLLDTTQNQTEPKAASDQEALVSGADTPAGGLPPPADAPAGPLNNAGYATGHGWRPLKGSHSPATGVLPT